MTDTDLVAAYLAEGGHVTVCPPRAFSENGLIEYGRNYKRKTTPVQDGIPGTRMTASRRRKVRDMLNAGKHPVHVAAALRVTFTTIVGDLRALRAAGISVNVTRREL